MYRFYIGCMLIALVGCTGKEIPQEEGLNLQEGNVKSFASPLLQSYQSCEQLEKELKETAMKKMRTRLAMRLKKIPTNEAGTMDMMPPIGLPSGAGNVAMAPPPMPAGVGGVEGVDFSGTNNQEKGVDEADIIKTDGKYFYVLNQDKLQVIDIQNDGTLVPLSVQTLKSRASSMVLLDDMLLVLSTDNWQNINKTSLSANDAPLKRNSFMSNTLRVDVINLGADRKNPGIQSSHHFQGELVAARKIGNKVHLAIYFDEDINGLEFYPYPGSNFYRRSAEEQKIIWAEIIADTLKSNEEIINKFDFFELMPTELSLDGNNLTRKPLSESDCSRSFGAKDGSSNGFLSLVTLTPNENGADIAQQWVRGNKPTVYASTEQFILASPEHEAWWFYDKKDLKDQTSIHRFALNTNDMPNYADSVRVPGILHNSFSLSEHQGFVRVATTTNRRRIWQNRENAPVEENNLYILGDNAGKFDIISSITGLARGEKIWSARFSGDKGFLVTFKQVDPLFTLDLRDPKNPLVAGKLKVPGVSTYLQDIGNDQVLAVGYGGNGDGLDFKTSVSLFDVSDFNNPKLAHSLSLVAKDGIDNSWDRFSSEANSNHLAINYFSPAALTAIPMEAHRYRDSGYECITKLVLVNTAPQKELSIQGEIDHSMFYEKNQLGFIDPRIRRSYFVGPNIYAFSANGITATRLSDLATFSTMNFTSNN